MNYIYLFSGQGAQKVGMLEDFYLNSQKGKELFEVFRDKFSNEFIDILLNGSQERLNRTIYSQPALLLAGVLVYEELKDREITPSICAGFSLGEYSALYAAGYISLEDVVDLIEYRSRIMDQVSKKVPGGMTAVRITDEEKLLGFLEDTSVTIANYNSKNQFVISGKIEELGIIEERLEKEDIVCVRLSVSGAFHSPIMKEVSELLEKKLETVNITTGKIPIVMNVDGEIESDPENIRKKLALQVSSPVKWTRTMDVITNSEDVKYLECGYGDTLTKLFNKHMRKNSCLPISSLADVEMISQMPMKHIRNVGGAPTA